MEIQNQYKALACPNAKVDQRSKGVRKSELAEKWLGKVLSDFTLARHTAIGAILDNLLVVRRRWLKATLDGWKWESLYLMGGIRQLLEHEARLRGIIK